MRRLSFSLPDDLATAIDRASARFGLSRGELIRRAVESWLEDLEDLRLARERLLDLADPVLSWGDVRGELLDGERS